MCGVIGLYSSLELEAEKDYSTETEMIVKFRGKISDQSAGRWKELIQLYMAKTEIAMLTVSITMEIIVVIRVIKVTTAQQYIHNQI